MKKYKKQPWTVDERRILSEYYFTLNLEDMAFMLPNRTEQAIKNQVTYLRKRGYRFKNGNKWFDNNNGTDRFSLVVCGECRVKIDVRNGKVDQALRKFKRKIMDDNRLFEYREREYYEKPAQKKKSKKKAAIMREKKRQEKFWKERK